MIVTRENTHKVRGTCPSAPLSTTNLRIEAGSKKRNLCCEKLVTNHPRQNKANVKIAIYLYHIYTSGPVPRKNYFLPITKPNKLILFGEIITVDCESLRTPTQNLQPK